MNLNSFNGDANRFNVCTVLGFDVRYCTTSILELIISAETTKAQLTAISSIIESYSFDAIRQRLQMSPKEIQVRIGFVGEFSSGKSTLINAIICDEVLPSRNTATTAGIIQIEADPQAQEPQRMSRGSDGKVRLVDKAEFDAIACGVVPETLILRMPPSALLQPGIQLIDSPGINSLLAGHSELTIAQLSLLDGLVICLHPEVGTVPASVQQFLARPEIQAVADRLLFVLTCTDQKSPQSIQRISEHMVATLAGVMPPNVGKPKLTHAQALNALEQQTDGIAAFSQAFNAAFVVRAEALRADRHAIHARQIAALVRTAVHAYLDAISFDDTDIRSKVEEAEVQISKLETLKNGEHARFTDWYQRLRTDLLATSQQFGPAMARATSAEVDTLMAQMEAALQGVAGKHIKSYAANACVVVQGLPPGTSAALASALKAHAKYVENGVTAVTMLATAAVTAGAGAGAIVAAETATATATGQALAATAAKEVAKEAGKSVAKAVTKEVASGIFKSMVIQAAAALKAINPLEMIGDVVRTQWNDSETSAQLPQIAIQLAESYRMDMLRHLDDTCFRPIEQDLLAAEQGMREARKERTASIDDAAGRKERAMGDLRILDAIIATEKLV